MSADVQAKVKVMVVDDDEVVLEVTRERLEAAGYDVVSRQSALGTSAAILRARPDVVLLDVRMPGLAGDALARLLRSGAAASPPAIVLYSSESATKLAILAKSCGAVGAVRKTSDAAAFLREFADCVAAAGIGASPAPR